ncbi:MAG: transketolase [Bacteroidales bacterium]|nr:transketolase [Bacteroidales bacterium]
MDVDFLTSKSKAIRRSVIESLYHAKSGHLGGSLGLADVFAILYFEVLNHRPEDWRWSDRDRLILSIGHVAPVLYATLAHSGYFPLSELNTLRKLGTRLQGHPSIEHQLPGIELAAGSLGQGLSVSVGLALAAKMDLKKFYTYCVLGDGELQEGSVWEAAMSASHHQLNQLIAIVDRNVVQIDGSTESVMQLEPLKDKWMAFGWQVLECDGHDFKALKQAFSKAKSSKVQPSVIIAHTKMGKGVKSIEDNYKWHGKAPNEEEFNLFLNALD